jgi:hypothetical protein
LYRLTLISVLLFNASGTNKLPIHQYADYPAGELQAVDGCLFLLNKKAYPGIPARQGLFLSEAA